MDAIVEAALRKWPNVPHCHGWLGLDARGDWYLRDERVQSAGDFPHPKGSRIEQRALRDFIGRNYAADASGGWYFQNGPQRVYVDLEAAPWVWRLNATPSGLSIETHTGLPATPRSAWLDESGRLFLDADLGFGLVHSLDMALAETALDAGTWGCEALPFDRMPGRFGYRLRPRPAAG